MAVFMIVNDTEKFTVWIATENKNSLFYSDKLKANRCDVIEMKNVKLSRKGVIYGHGNMQLSGGG